MDMVEGVAEDATFDIVPVNSKDRTFNIGVIKIPSFYINFEEAQKGVKDY